MKKTARSEMLANVMEYDLPTDIMVETNAFCNLQCIMCPQKEIRRPKGEMSFNLWEKIVSELAADFPETTLWPAIMGEPLMQGEEFFKYVSLAKRKGIRRVHMNSNFNLFDKGLVSPLFDSGLDSIYIGVDASTEETYRKIRVGGNFYKLLENIELLVNEKNKRNSPLQVSLLMILQNENASEEQSFIDYWKKKALGVTLRLRYRISWGGSVEPSKEIIAASQSEARYPCLWLLRQMSVLWDGRIPWCDSPNEYFAGDANSQSLKEVWTGALKKVRDRQLSGDFSMLPCNNCSDWNCGKSVNLKV